MPSSIACHSYLMCCNCSNKRVLAAVAATCAHNISSVALASASLASPPSQRKANWPKSSPFQRQRPFLPRFAERGHCARSRRFAIGQHAQSLRFTTGRGARRLEGIAAQRQHSFASALPNASAPRNATSCKRESVGAATISKVRRLSASTGEKAAGVAMARAELSARRGEKVMGAKFRP